MGRVCAGESDIRPAARDAALSGVDGEDAPLATRLARALRRHDIEGRLFLVRSRSPQMRCFYHRDVDAIATCRSCCRGLCDACAAEVGKLSACRERCEADVAAMQALLARSDRAFVTAGRQLRIAALICVLFAGLFVVLSRRMPFAMALWLLLPAAFVLLIGAVLLVLNARRYDTQIPRSANR